MSSRDRHFDTPQSLMQFALWLKSWLPLMERYADAKFVPGEETAADRTRADAAVGTFDNYVKANEAVFDRRVKRAQLELEVDYVTDGRGLDASLYSDDVLAREHIAVAMHYLKDEHERERSRFLEAFYERRRRRAAVVLRHVGDALRRELMRVRYRVRAIIPPDTSHRDLSPHDLAGAVVDLQGNALINGSIRYEAVAISMKAPRSVELASPNQPGRRKLEGTVIIKDELRRRLKDPGWKARSLSATLIAEELRDWYLDQYGENGLPADKTIINNVAKILRTTQAVPEQGSSETDPRSRPN